MERSICNDGGGLESMTRSSDLQSYLGGGNVGINPNGTRIPREVLSSIGADKLDLNAQGEEKKGFSVLNAVGNFFKGAVVDTISGLFSTKGILMLGATAGAIALMGPAILPYLLGVGLVTGGVTAAKGA